MDDDTPAAGLTILRASRLEALIGPLQELLEMTRPEHPLAPQRVIAAHPGMKQWLTGALARHVGPRRIVANLEVLLPSAWLDGLSESLLGARAVALPQYRRTNLRWTLHALLGRPADHGVTDPRVLSYLSSAASDDERGLRRFQLADRLARVYSQYQVYRGDWLAAWEAGKGHFATARRGEQPLKVLEAEFLAPLWKVVTAKLGEHRGRLVEALSTSLAAPRTPLPPLHLFGLSHLPPAELAVLRQYAGSAPVFMYLPDPCREYWGGLHAGAGDGRWRTPDIQMWEAFRQDEARRLEDPDAIDWRDQGHPLLARWGRMGQHFFAALAEGEVREDTRHWQDERAEAPCNRLQRLQESIRQLAPGLMYEDVGVSSDGAPDDEPAAADRKACFELASADASLRIHACHTRHRELEVLRDAMLDAMERDDTRAGDIVVMAPDIQAYLPMIPAVFGEPGSTRERLLPYHLADVPIARSHPLFGVVETLLGMGASRITAPEVADLLGVAEVRRALALGDNEADTLVEWLRNSRVAWGLDGAHKGALELPARAEYTFAWATDRMLAGYLMGDSRGEANDETVLLPDNTELLPLVGIEGPASSALGSLDRLLIELQAWRGLADAERSASAWVEVIRERVDALMRIDPADTDARAALSVIHRAIANLVAEPARNEENPTLRFAVVRDLLQDALEAAPEKQRFLMGGITFCGMVPQRAIPFDMVCVLGLDEGAFPRRPSDGGIDLMARLRRVGDRDVPTDDRYLFMETLMSARRRLHLSYIGQGVRDGKHRNPAAPLAELIAELDLRCDIAPDDDHTPRPWLVRHPLQPFDTRYFDGSHPALFSYSATFAGMTGGGNQSLPRLRDGLPLTSEPLPDPLPLALLEGWFKDPAKALLKDHLQVTLDALDADARLPEDEPMDGISRVHSVARRVFFEDVLPRKCGDPEWQWDQQPPSWVAHGGLLPLGESGREAWQAEAESVIALWSKADACGRFDERGARGGQAVRVDVPLVVAGDEVDAAGMPRVITGTLRNVFPLKGSAHGANVVFAHPNPSDERERVKKEEALDFKARVPAFLHWALLRLQRAGGTEPMPVRLTILAKGQPDFAAQANAWDERYCMAGAAERAALEADLRRRVRALVELRRAGRQGLSFFYPAAAWKVTQAIASEDTKSGRQSDAKSNVATVTDDSDSDAESAVDSSANSEARLAILAKSVRPVWVKDFGDGDGERDYAPGYASLLEGDLVFGDPETDPESRALKALVQDAQLLNELILLGGDAPSDLQDANASMTEGWA